MEGKLPHYNFQEGEILLFDKPYGWTSFDVVNKVRYLIRKQLGVKKIKVGHAGTLDPLATGLLILCTGKFTKKIDTIQGLEKTYTGTMKLGATTPSFDLETQVDASFPTEHLNPEKLMKGKINFIGEIEQVPPIFSAIKVDGVRSYEKARKNEDVKLQSRKVEIYNFELTQIQIPDVDFKVVCSKGTYIRSLVRDFALTVNTGGHLTALCRTQIGTFKLTDALTIKHFENQLNQMEKS